MPTILPDLVSDSGLERSYEGPRLIESATRVVQVTDLNDGSGNATATAMDRAVLAVAQQYPPYLRYSSTSSAVVMGHQGAGIFDDVIRVKVIYRTPTKEQGDSNGGVNLIISDDTSTVPDTTQFGRDSTGKLVQLILKATNANNAALNKQWVGTTTYDRTLRRIVMAGVTLSQNLDPYRLSVNKVNTATWMGLPRGYWRVMNWRSNTQDLGKSYTVQIELLADTERDWSRYVVLRDRNTGCYITVRQQIIGDLEGKPYEHFIQYPTNGNIYGILRYGPYPVTNFVPLFGQR